MAVFGPPIRAFAVRHSHRTFAARWLLPVHVGLISIGTCVGSPAAPMPGVFPIAFDQTNSGFSIRNTSDNFVVVTLFLSGNNFASDMPCEWKNYLFPGRSAQIKVSPKDISKTRDFRVRVKNLEVKTITELQHEAASQQDAPTARPVTPDEARAFESSKCRSH